MQFPYQTGDKVFLRTVTYHVVGEIKEVGENFLTLRKASWVADTERFSVTVETGALREVEPVGDMIVNIAAITDGFPWHHELPTKAK